MLFDSLLGLFVLTICGLLLVPIYIAMQQNEQRQQLHLHASQVLLSAATFMKEQGDVSGTQYIDNRRFNWYFENDALCVVYDAEGQEVEQCVSKTSTASH